MKELLNIQQALKVPKNQYNSFGKYHYRSCEDILEAVKPLLKENNVTLLLSDDVVEAGGHVFLKATATLTDGEIQTSVTGTARIDEVRKGMSGDQLTGAASSYARKYALNGLFAIDDTKDADTQKPAENPKMSLEEAFNKVNKATSEEELESLYKSLPPELRKDGEVIAKCKEIKEEIISQ